MKDLLGAALGLALLVFGLATERDNHILVGTLTIATFLGLYFWERKKARSAERQEGSANHDPGD